MRRALVGLVLLAWLAAPALVPAQEQGDKAEPESKTKLGAFLMTTGKVLQKEFRPLGYVGYAISVESIVVSELGRGARKLRGLRIEVRDTAKQDRTRQSVLDFEEAESLSAALVYMEKLAGEWNGTMKEAYTEVAFETNDDFRVGFYQEKEKNKQTAFASSGRISKTHARLSLDDLPKLRALIDTGIAQLREP
jgi:hypothetical protein